MFASLLPPWLAWPALIGLVTALPVGAGAWMMSRYEDAAERARFEQAAAQAAQSLALRLHQCDTRMLALAAWLDSAGPTVDAAGWQRMEARLRLGLSGACTGTVAFMPILAQGDVAAHEATQSARLGQPYQVQPPGPRPWYTPIALIAPASEQNRRVLGKDPWHDPGRRSVLERARDSGRPAATGRIGLRVISDNAKALILQAPVYRQGLPLDTVEQRRAALFGFVGQPLFIDTAIAATAAEHPGLQLALIDPLEEPEATRPPAPGNALDRPLRFGERDWLLRAHPAAGLQALGAWRASTAWLLAGLLLALLAAAASGLLLRQRARAYHMARRFSRKARTNASGVRAVLDGARDGILQLNTRGRIVAANRAAEQMLGRAGLVGCPATELLGPADVDLAIELFISAVQMGRLGQSMPARELTLLHATGTPLPVRCSISRAMVRERETMVWLIGDISREHALQAQAAQAERLNALLLDAVPSALLLVDGEGIVMRCNPAACDLLAYPEAELIGLPMAHLHDAADAAEPLEAPGPAGPGLRRSRRDSGGRLVEMEWSMRRRDCGHVPVSMLAVAVNAATSPQDARRADRHLGAQACHRADRAPGHA